MDTDRTFTAELPARSPDFSGLNRSEVLAPDNPADGAKRFPFNFSAASANGLKRLALSYGGDLPAEPDRPQLLSEALEGAATKAPDNGLIYLQADGSELFQSYPGLLQQARRIQAGLRRLGLKPQDKVILQLEENRQFVPAFWGCVLGGIVPVPVSIPATYECANGNLSKLQKAWELLGQPLVLTDAGQAGSIQQLARLFGTAEWNVVAIQELQDDAPAMESAAVQPDDVALIMLTSGSTGVPKAVQLTHRNLISRAAGAARMNGFSAEDITLNWMGLDHVAGITYFHLRDVFLGCRQLHASTAAVIQNPLIWIDWLSHYRVTTTFAPNFAYGLVVSRAEEIARRKWDLSAVRHFLNGGEAVVAKTARTFLKLLQPHGLSPAAMRPAWGMSETSSGVTYSHTFSLETTRDTDSFVEVGRPIAGVALRIVDDRDQLVAEGEIGRLQVAGDTITCGYFGDPSLNEEAFTADGWFKTGDLGFLRHGCLTITGREKDLIIINSVKYHSHEIESLIEELAGIETSFTAACAVRPKNADTDQLAVFFHTPLPDAALRAQLIRQIRSAVTRRFGIIPAFVLPVEKEVIPKTEIGKIQRPQLRQRFEAGEFAAFIQEAESPERLEVMTGITDESARAHPGNGSPEPETELEQQVACIWREVLGLRHVARDASFFELGGDSLRTVQILSRVREAFNLELPVRSLFQEAATIAGMARAIAAARIDEAPLPSESLRPGCRSAPLPLSCAQQRLWFLDRLEPGNSAYNLCQAFRLEGELDVRLLEQSFNEMAARHEVLRTSFQLENGQPAQVIAPTLKLPLPVFDLRLLPKTQRADECRRLIREQAHQPFDLNRGPLVRLALLRRDEANHLLLLTMHHIISDGWSLGVLLQELTACYAALSEGRAPALAPLPIQYGDFACWQREWIRSPALQEQLSYWKDQLAGNLPVLDFPADRPRPAVQTSNGAIEARLLPRELGQQLKTFARAEGATLFMTLLAAFKVLLHRYSGQDDLIVGTPVAGRSRVETEPLIGFFVNMLALRTNLAGDPPFRELLQRVREMAWGAFAHSEVPFEKLVEHLQPQRDRSRNPLFQVLFVLQNAPQHQLELPGLTVKPVPVDTGTAKLDISVCVTEGEAGLQAEVEYNTDLFDAATIRRLLTHFQTLLEAVVARPETRLSQLPLMSQAERDQVLVEWNETSVDYPRDRCIHQLFEAQAARQPEALAVICDGQQLTYAQLDARANQVARHLQRRGAGPEVLVGICMERSLEMIVGLLGILKAGSAYVPLDPAYPPERLAFMLEDARVPVLLLQERLVKLMPRHKARTICLDTDWEIIGREPADPPPRRVHSSNLAYVIYTSGSTGKPKGVLVEHRHLVHSTTARISHYEEPVKRFLLLSPFAFDSSVAGVFWTLSQGGTLVLPKDDSQRDGAALAGLIARHEITHLLCVPTLYAHLLEFGGVRPSSGAAAWSVRTGPQSSPALEHSGLAAPEDGGTTACAHFGKCAHLASLRCVIVAGEPCPREIVARHFESVPEGALYNEYGPTEATVWSTVHRCSTAAATQVPIGRPIPNARIYVLDRHGRPAPIGVPGEIFIGGPGVTRGYLNRPELTAEKFVADPFNPDPGARLYRTGDLARYRSNGEIEFLGRLDAQVKVRGYRIELGEIEAGLRQHAAVRDCAVMVRDENGNKRLVAYAVQDPAKATTASELRRFLKQKLPEYMVPSAFVFLEALPLSPNGKVDLKALPAPSASRPHLDRAFTAPGTPTEEVVAAVWAEVLGVGKVGLHDNFFELGGHSLLVTQVISRLRDVFQVELPLRSLFETPTVRQLVEAMLAQEPGAGAFERVARDMQSRGTPGEPQQSRNREKEVWTSLGT